MIRYGYREIMVEAFKEYIASEEWRYVKLEVMERDNYTCVDCGKNLPEGRNGIVHHEHYDDWGKGNREEINSCVFICRKCHNGRHAHLEMKRKVPFWAARYPETDGFSDEEFRDAMMKFHRDRNK
jgi:5-methylcytosine-specific restriction endonuclease McrA